VGKFCDDLGVDPADIVMVRLGAWRWWCWCWCWSSCGVVCVLVRMVACALVRAAVAAKAR
jgi:hypothetical protein